MICLSEAAWAGRIHAVSCAMTVPVNAARNRGRLVAEWGLFPQAESEPWRKMLQGGGSAEHYGLIYTQPAS